MPRRWLNLVGNAVELGHTVNIVSVYSSRPHIEEGVVSDWYQNALRWTEQLGLKPIYLSSLGIPGFKEGKRYYFDEKADVKLRKQGFNEVGELRIVGGCSSFGFQGKNEPSSVKITSSMSLHVPSNCMWLWDDDRAPFDEHIIQPLFEYANERNMLDYAMAFQMNSKDNPVVEGSLTAFEKRIIENGRCTTKCYGDLMKSSFKAGSHAVEFIKDVYPYQVLSSVHLAYLVDGKTLGEWVESSEFHGELREFGQSRWLWKIPEKYLQKVRKTLIDNNLLTLYLPDMSRILEEYGRSA